MKMIALTQGKKAIVDDGDFEMLKQWKWHFNGAYAVRGVRRKSVKNGYQAIMMHRLINNTPDGYETDHINRNKLDNRRANLRTATRAENRYNTEPRQDNKTGVKGVSWYKPTKRWVAHITINRKQKTIGYFKEFEEAVKARLNQEQKNGIQTASKTASMVGK